MSSSERAQRSKLFLPVEVLVGLALSAFLLIAGCHAPSPAPPPPLQPLTTDTSPTPDPAHTGDTAAPPPSEEEDCTDGVDEDGDGLVDCEDADCFDTPACTEACTDEVDNDLDGLVDCEDDDCWGLGCHPEGVRVQVLSGRLSWTRNALHRWQGRNRTCFSSPFFTSTGAYKATFRDYSHTLYRHSGVLTLADVAGRVRVLAPGKQWATETAATTCTWSFSAGSLVFDTAKYWESDAGSGTATLGPVRRAGMHVAPGCRLLGSDFLPSQLLPMGTYVALPTAIGYESSWRTYAYYKAPGDVWYSGQLVGSGFSSSPRHDVAPGCSSSWAVWTATMDPLVQTMERHVPSGL